MAEESGESDFERELRHAYDAFQAAMVSGSGKNRKDTATGHTFWDIVAKYSHSELEDMIFYLERNSGKMSPSELVKHHLRIVEYFNRIGQLNTPGTQGFNVRELQAVSKLYDREGKQEDLEYRLRDARTYLTKLTGTKRKLDEYFQILHDHLYNDKRSLVEPKQRDALLNDSSIRMRAFRFYTQKTSGKDVAGTFEPQSEVGIFLALDSGEVSHHSLVKADLANKVAAYMAVGYFVNYFEEQISETRNATSRIDAAQQEVKLTRDEGLKLRTFEAGGDAKYSPSNYLAAYTNAVWAQIQDFLSDCIRVVLKLLST